MGQVVIILLMTPTHQYQVIFRFGILPKSSIDMIRVGNLVLNSLDQDDTFLIIAIRKQELTLSYVQTYFSFLNNTIGLSMGFDSTDERISFKALRHDFDCGGKSSL